jgi:ribosomal protein S24E
MDVRIDQERYNALLKRREVKFTVEHPRSGTSSLNEARTTLASKLNVALEKTYIIKLTTKTGTHLSVGEAEIYDDESIAKKLVPEHILKRNTPTRRKKEEAKKEEPKRKEPKKEEPKK